MGRTKQCSVDGCEGKRHAKGLCSKHYDQNRKLQPPPKNDPGCLVKECNNRHGGNGYCDKHNTQMKTYGKIFERTMHDRNEFTVDGNVCTIQIYDRKKQPKCQVLIDLEDLPLVKEYKWCVNKAVHIFNRKVGHLSRFIMGIKDFEIKIDHINHDRLDNRKENLRACTNSENCQNLLIDRKNNTSGAKGVSWSSDRQKWVARIWQNNKPIPLGRFESKREAILAYNEAAIKYHGEFALLNEIPDKKED